MEVDPNFNTSLRIRIKCCLRQYLPALLYSELLLLEIIFLLIKRIGCMEYVLIEMRNVKKMVNEICIKIQWLWKIIPLQPKHQTQTTIAQYSYRKVF